MPLNIEVTQFPNGIGTVSDDSVLNGVATPLPTNGANVIEDFTGGSNYDDNWSTVAIAGGATPSAVANPGGVLRLTTGAAGGDGASLEADAGSNLVDGLLMEAGTPLWIGARLRISDAVESRWFLGFIPGGSGVAPTDGLFLTSPASSGDVQLVVANNATGSDIADVVTLGAGDTGFVEVGIYWDGEKASAQIRGVGGASIEDPANVPTVGLNATLTGVAAAGGAVEFDADWIAFGGGRS